MNNVGFLDGYAFNKEAGWMASTGAVLGDAAKGLGDIVTGKATREASATLGDNARHAEDLAAYSKKNKLDVADLDGARLNESAIKKGDDVYATQTSHTMNGKTVENGPVSGQSSSDLSDTLQKQLGESDGVSVMSKSNVDRLSEINLKAKELGIEEQFKSMEEATEWLKRHKNTQLAKTVAVDLGLGTLAVGGGAIIAGSKKEKAHQILAKNNLNQFQGGQ